jgi:hypothetical protein
MASSINASTSGAGGVITTADNTGILNLQTASTTAVTVDASQNVGIGTTSPAQLLEVKKDQAGSTRIKVTNKTNNSASTAGLLFENSTSDVAQVQLWDSGTVGALTAYGLNMEGTGSGGVNLAASNASGVIRFATGGTTQRMSIDAGGKLIMASVADGTLGTIQAGITANTGSTNAIICVAANANGAYPFGARGESTNQGLFGFFNSSNTAIASITKSGNSVAYNTSSDYRLKENIAPMTGALDKVSALKPVTYTWKEDGLAGQGFIAHELQAVVPDAVSGEKDAVETYTDEEGNDQTRIKPQGIDTSFLVATLTAAIQEQQTIINDLKARITALEGAA